MHTCPMSDIAITVENLGKSYLVGHNAARSEGYTALRDVIARNARNLARKTRDMFKGHAIVQGDQVEEFWALKNVSFEIKQGDRVGIIGRNGAGKSTLLKILSRITEPTKGRIKIAGRVASLLEVGTGFHPELTGRENMYLNGAVLGMTRREIQRKFDEIVAFAEVEQFLDTPVKRYSSGMYVRLAFAVAAHLEPEILIVDEVLAVGDAQFQKKCLGKMEAVSKDGRTVLFVSHNMSSIRGLCSRAILLKKGLVELDGPVKEVTDSYLREAVGDNEGCSAERFYSEDLKKGFQLLSIRLKDKFNQITQSFDCDATISIEIDCVSRRSIPGLYGYLEVVHREGQIVLVSDTFDVLPNRLDRLVIGKHTMNIEIPARSLAAGEYLITIVFMSHQSSSGLIVDSPGETVAFTLNDTNSLRGNTRQGYFSTLLEWKLNSHS